MDDDDSAFDFGSWCVVCGRLVEPPASLQQAQHASTSASSSPAHSPALSTQAAPKPKRQTSVKRNKSSSKLHAHSRTRSGARLNQLGGLGPSTQIHKGKDSSHKQKDQAAGERGGDHSGGSTPPLKSKAEQEAELAAEEQEELSSLYCSLECQREDQAGAAGTATATQMSPRVRPSDPRRHSSSSSTHSATSASSPLNSFAAFPSPHSYSSNDALPGGLDFSTRRNSRGATYRPLAMSRTLSSDQGAAGGAGSPAFGQGSSRGSSSSLAGMGEDERSTSSERSYPRPLSSLSALRGMTPIPTAVPPSPTFPPSVTSPSKLRPSGSRTQSDKPPSTARFASPSRGSEREDSRGRREEETPEEREKRKQERRARSRARREANRMGIGAPSAGKMAQSVPANLGLGLEELHLSSLPTRPSGPSPIPSRTPNRSSSSASLALMSSSFSKSYSGSGAQSFDSRSTSRFLAPKVTRSESTASLSGLNATGTILPPSSTGAGDTSSPSTFVPPPPRPPMYSPTHPRSSLSIPPLLGAGAGAESSSPSSTTTSSFTNSHQSAHSHSTSHSSRSYLSSSAGSGSNSHLTGHRERGRTTRGLQMTPSSSSLAAAGAEGSTTMQRSASGHEKSRTPKKLSHPPPPDRAASTPATIRRPSIYQTAPTPSPHRASSTSGVGSPARPSALQTPSLSYLTAEAAAEKPLSAKQRTFSWDNLGVKAYHSLDLDEVRAAKEDRRRDGAGEGKPPALGQQRAKKKLFHFAMDDEE